MTLVHDTCEVLALMNRFPSSAAALILLLLALALPGHCLSGHDYTVRIDADGKLSVDHKRTPVVITSYAGMFGKLPTGSPMYWISANRNLQVETVEDADHPRVILSNTGDRGVTMRREAAILPGKVRLSYEIIVAAGVAGSIDTGFTLSPELAYGAHGTLWEKPGAEGRAVRLGADGDALPYQSPFQKVTFDGAWGKLTIEFESGEGMQAQGALLNGARASRRPGEWVQILPLFTAVAARETPSTYRAACTVSFEPVPGKQYLSPRRNLLYGGDFETWRNPDLPDGWRRDPCGTPGNAAGLAPDEKTKCEGARSLRWSLPAGSLTHATQWLGYWAPATMDGPYVFSCQIRSEPPGVQVALRCGAGTKQVQATGQWQRVAVATKIKPGQPLPVIRLEKLSAGTLWVDAAQLEAGDEPTPFIARAPESVFSPQPFPADTLAKEFFHLPLPAPLSGCGPEFSFYTRERQGRLIYHINLPTDRRATASLAISLTGPDGKPLARHVLQPPLPARVTVPLEVAALPLGASTASAELLDNGQPAGNLKHPVVKLAPSPQGTEVKINRLTRVLWRDGQPVLPCGSDASTTTERTLENIRDQAANGFNHLHLWSGFFEFEKTPGGTVPKLNPAALTQILDAAQAAGMTVTVNLSHWLSINHFHKGRFTNPDVTDEEILRRAREVVRLARSHPAVLGWHLIDEPDPAYCTPEWIARIYREVKDADPYHPAEINVGGSALNMTSFLDGSDYVSVDIYPVPIAHIGTIAPHTRHMRLTGGWRPIRWWIQSVPYVYEPTAAEETCMAYQALAEGTRFMLFYNYRPTSYAAWAGLGQVAAEMRALQPALAAEREDAAARNDPDGRLVASLHHADGAVWLIAVNRDTEPVAAEFVLPADCAGREAEVLFEGRRLKCAGAALRDTFAPLARHVYRVQ